VYYLQPDTTTSPLPGDNVSITQGNGNFVAVPAPCIVVGLNVGVNNFSSPSGADTSTVTVYKNSVATAMSCSVTTDGNGSSCSDSTHIFTVNGGDTLSLAFSETNINPFNKITTSLVCQ